MNDSPSVPGLLGGPRHWHWLGHFLGRTLYYCLLWVGLYVFMLIFGCSGFLPL